MVWFIQDLKDWNGVPSMSKEYKKKVKSKNPIGVTCHYERIDSEWFIVWDYDFPEDTPGKLKVIGSTAMYLEMGYQIGKAERRVA